MQGCDKKGHLQKDCRRKLGLCLICGKSGHNWNGCPEKKERGQRQRQVVVDKATTVLKEETDTESATGFVDDL